MRAALYARFSTEKQSECSIEDQFRVCERIADREGFQIVARFSDAAISGGTSTRPGYQSLLRAARRREIDVIVAEDSSRLWRELSEQWRALKELQDLGVLVVGHGLDTRREESKILLAISGAMAEAYRDEIARRTRRGLEGRAVAGQPTGGKAYGYIAARDSSTGKIEVNEDQAAIARRVVESIGAAEIWLARGLRIVPQELWDRVKSRQKRQSVEVGARIKNALRRNAPGAGRPGRYLLSGLLRCGVCDARFTLADSRSYACSSHFNGAACTNKLRVRRTLVESRILESVKSDLRNPEVIAEVERQMTRALSASKPKASDRARIAKLQQEIDNLADAIAGGLLKSSPALAARLSAAESELARLLAERDHKAPVVGRIAPRVVDRYMAAVAKLEEGLGRDVERTRAALADVIGERITLQPDESMNRSVPVGGAGFHNNPTARRSGGAGNYGSGGAMWAVPPVAQSVRLK